MSSPLYRPNILLDDVHRGGEDGDLLLGGELDELLHSLALEVLLQGLVALQHHTFLLGTASTPPLKAASCQAMHT